MALSLGRAWSSSDQRGKLGVNDGARTRDISDHNRVLYQLSYAHHVLCGLSLPFPQGDLSPSWDLR
jgi:hypothetical protein